MAKASHADDEKKGEFSAGPVAGTALMSGQTFTRKPLQYAEFGGLAIFEGDIVLGTVDEVRAMASAAPGPAADAGIVLQSVGITGAQYRWPNATIPYEIAANLPNQQRVTGAISHWQTHTRIRFVVRTGANANQYPDYVRFVPGGGCSSQVGRRGGPQDITLGPNCTMGNAIHEIGHAVGLWHEQSREDRDHFVRIEWANIDPAYQHNFDQHIADGDDMGAYDYGSIMHYPANAFSNNGQDTIVPLQPLGGAVLGQRAGLSPGDIAGVHQMYPAVAPPPVKPGRKDIVADPGTIKETWKDPTADGTLKEVRKDAIFDPGGTAKEVRKDPIFDPVPTIKEVARDPIFPFAGAFNAPSAGGYNAPPAGVAPFVMAGANQFAGGNVAELAAQVQALGEALAGVQQQLAQLSAAYETVMQAFGGWGVGSG